MNGCESFLNTRVLPRRNMNLCGKWDERKSEIRIDFQLFCSNWETFKISNAKNIIPEINHVELDNTVLEKTINRIHRDIVKIECFHPDTQGINEFKYAGHLTYWFCRTKPIQKNVSAPIGSEPTIDYINAIFAITLSVTHIVASIMKRFKNSEYAQEYLALKKAYGKDEQIEVAIRNCFREKNFYNNLLYTLSYRHITAAGLSLMYEGVINGFFQGIVQINKS